MDSEENINGSELLLKNLEFYTMLKSMILCSDNNDCLFKDNKELQNMLIAIEAGIFRNKNQLYKPVMDSIINRLTVEYNKIQKQRMEYLMFNKTPTTPTMKLPIPPTTIQTPTTPTMPELKLNNPTTPPISPNYTTKPHALFEKSANTIIKFIASGTKKWSAYASSVQEGFKNYFNQRYGYGFNPKDDTDAQTILNALNQGGKRSDKRSKKYKSRKLNKSFKK